MAIEKGATRERLEERIDELLQELSLEEKVAMLSGHGFFDAIQEDGRYCGRMYPISAGNERLEIPHLLFGDGPRGVDMGASTCFPVPMARGASFDVELERRVGDAIGREMRAHGGNLFGGVCINLLRHPAWGRAQETYGEDPFLLGEMGAALSRGVQHHNVVATVKHFAANSMENARFKVDVQLEERPLREVYLPHFKRALDAGAGAVMSAYNQLNGAFCGHNPELLTRILKEEWGFDGHVYSDFVMGCRSWDAFLAGLDVEAPDTVHFGDKLLEAAKRGDVPDERLDDGVRRVLRTLFRVLAAPDPETYPAEAIACEAHVALAREVAEKSIVLLRNEDVLPWSLDSLRRVAVIGGLAAQPNLGDHGSSRVFPPYAVTPVEGLKEALPEGCELVHVSGEDLERARSEAAAADAVLVVAGYTHRDEGEFIPAPMAGPMSEKGDDIGGDRLDLSLGSSQEALIAAVAEANPRAVVAVMAGSAVTMEAFRERVGAILMLWYPGMEGGTALARVLLGEVAPSGRLPFTVPRRAEDLPHFDRDADSIRYDLWHGYTKLERDGTEPAWAFGFGLSYTRFALAAPEVEVDAESDRLRVRVEVTNEGERAADTVVQVYAGFAEPDPAHPRKRLCGFARASLSPGETEPVTIAVPLRDLAWFDTDAGEWTLGEAAWRVFVGQSSAIGESDGVDVELPARSWNLRER